MDIAKKTLKIFDEVIEKYRKTKDFFLIDLYAPQVIKTEKITENKKTIESQVQDNKLLKEVVIIDNDKVKKQFWENGKPVRYLDEGYKTKFEKFIDKIKKDIKKNVKRTIEDDDE